MKWFWRKGEQKRQAPEKQEKMAEPQHKQETHSRDWQERMALWEQERLKRESWLKEHPAQKAQFSYLRDMLSLDVLSFGDTAAWTRTRTRPEGCGCERRRCMIWSR